MENPFDVINEELKQIRGMLSQLLTKNATPSQSEQEYPVNIERAQKVLLLSRSSMYQNMASIPHRKRNGRLYFFESELLAYINSGESVLTSTPVKSVVRPRKICKYNLTGN